MAESLRGYPVRLRAHAKTHKCPVIAHHQIMRGAVGVCCQTLGEAEAMVAGGVRNILITNQVVEPGKMARLAALAAQAEVLVCVDDEGNVRDLDLVAGGFGVRLPVLVEVDIGQNRCGVDPGEPALALARSVAGRPNLRFAGIQAYHGKAQHLYDLEERVEVVERAVALVRSTVELIRSEGLSCEVVTGGGTGSYPIEAASGVYNEVQAGSYIFMDADYKKVDGVASAFEASLFVLTTVLSRAGGRAVCDAGLKASSIDSGLPLVKDRPEILYLSASDEHGTLRPDDRPLLVGDRLFLIPGHCDPTVNLHDWFVGVRNGRVEAIWPIAARGANT